MRRYIFSALVALLCSTIDVGAKITHLLPTPKIVKESNGTFNLNEKIRIEDESQNALLEKFIVQHCRTTKKRNAPSITVKMVESIEGSLSFGIVKECTSPAFS